MNPADRYGRSALVKRKHLQGKLHQQQGLPDLNVPVNFYQLRPHLYGFGIPVTNDHLKKLESLNIGLIVSLTQDPLASGRVINHQPPASPLVVNPEFHMTDDDLFEGVTIEIMHLPIHDAYPPDTITCRKFLKRAHEVVESGKSVGVHCWKGKGRTGTLLASYLIRYENVDPVDAINEIKSLSKGSIRSKDQRNYLMNPRFPRNTLDNSQPDKDVIYTPNEAECYSE
eukprot:TRINITY_DN10671_c0_g1_i1.p1 TRINITY_DN10671_c0_g1~~TRINITY_DN10671_c0_g1_i1.p1  ORF type:complete len:227 (-),score=31.23 TRINITY_DN10671_c0_g1_i1:59-739(-)